MFYLVTIKRSEYDAGTTYAFEERADAQDFIERAIEHAVPDKDGEYPQVVLKLDPGASEEVADSNEVTAYDPGYD